MPKIIDMQDLRYLNLFDKVTRVRTRICFKYNETVIFCVPKPFVSKAIGEGGRNVKKINQIIGKRVKVISSLSESKDLEGIKRFIGDVVKPLTFKDLNLNDDGLVLTAGSMNKAALIGRNKRRLLELQKISRDYFNSDLRII